jgi:hypothetical protein
MKKKTVLTSFLFILIVFLNTYNPSPAHAFNFNGYPYPPKERMDGNTPIYYYDLRSPENRGGLVPASGKHFQERPDLWEKLMNNARAYKAQVWNQVWAWENQSLPPNSFIIKQRDLIWTGNLQSSIDATIRQIKQENPDYYVKEAFVYPVHYERTYPVSAADALRLMAIDEYNGTSDLNLEIDYGFSTVPNDERPYGNGSRSTVWKSLYFRTPPFTASDGQTYSFNTIQDVFKPINGKTPWLNGPGFWSNWAIDENNPTQSLEALVDNRIWYGRAHPVLYTPGNDPYMRTMIWTDWSYYGKNIINGYLYFNWHAMVSDNDYKIEAIMVKRASSDPPPSGGGGGGGGSCGPSIIGGELRYQYELDLQVTRIEGETVESGSTTLTPVTVYRKDYSANREQVRNEIEADIARAESEKAQLEAELAQLENQKKQLESQLAKAQSDKAACQAQPPDKNGKKPDCSSFDSQISSLQAQIQAKQAEIDKKKCDIAKKDAEIAGFQKELDDLQALEDQWRVVNTNVLLTFNGSQKGIQPVSLQEGETKTLYFNWTLPSDGTVRGEINPYRSLGIDEVTYSNNALSTPIYIATHATASCSPIGGTSSVNGVVRTITVDGGSTTYLREYLTGQIVNQSRTSMRAGYGFSFEVRTTYRNEDPQSQAYGPTRTESYFPTLVNYLPYQRGSEGFIVNMDLTQNSATNPPRNETKTWSLPVTFVEEYSGNVFDSNYASNPNHNPNENILNGGRKWYVDFEQPDGDYNFRARSFNAGVNKLNVCMNGNVKIDGSFIGDPNGNDDFVWRHIDPNNPFPAGVGWNWNGKLSIIGNLKNWWNEWRYPDPDTTPSGWHLDTITLTPSKIQQIKEYNKSHPLKELKVDNHFESTVGY